TREIGSKPVRVGRVPGIMREVPGELGGRAQRMISLPGVIRRMHPVGVRGYLEIIDDPGAIRQRKHLQNILRNRVEAADRDEAVGKRSAHVGAVDIMGGRGIEYFSISQSLASRVNGRRAADG